jgi:hypothetical protein
MATSKLCTEVPQDRLYTDLMSSFDENKTTQRLSMLCMLDSITSTTNIEKETGK